MAVEPKVTANNLVLVGRQICAETTDVGACAGTNTRDGTDIASGSAMRSARDAGAFVAGGHGLEPTDWIAEHLSFFFQEVAEMAMRRALSKWHATTLFLVGLAAGGGLCSSRNAACARVRAEKIFLVRQMDEQAEELSHAAMVLALKSSKDAAPTDDHTSDAA